MALLPFDNREGFMWLNGDLIPWKDANIHVLSHALHYGSCVFEGERAYNSKIFKLDDHTQRLFDSAKALDINIPYSPKQISEACNKILSAQKISNGYIRPVVWRGSEQMGVSAQKTKINVAIAAWEWPSYFNPEERLRGIKMNISKWRRPAPNTAPCHSKAAGLYMICTLSRHEAEANGFSDSLMLDHEGNIAEATGANIFFVQDGILHTPTPNSFLNGITRQTVISLAEKKQIRVVDRLILLSELKNFTECFITGTAVEVTPVSLIDKNPFVPGEITKMLMEDYDLLVGK